MKDHSTPPTNVSAEQEAIRAKCFHPSGTFVEFKKDEIEQSIPERFEKMVRLYPDRIAVKAEDRSLTYDELNQAANRIAHALLVQRGKQEEPIGLVLDHGVEAVTAILGVLKAGKMYVPLDPSFPMSRNRDVLEDSEPGLIVTDNKNFPLAVELASKKLALINIDEFRRSYPVENTDLGTAPDTLAYILYTSGSTGKPKGVVQNHRNVLHLIMRHTNRAHISPDDRTAVLRSFSVHGGTLQTFGGLLNGAAILPFDIKREGVQELAHWLAREEVTLCRMGPTLFRHLAEVLGEKDHFPKLREISFSGEPLHKNDVELWRQHFSDECILVNSFGATEVSSCCEYLVDKKTRIEDGVVPCGYPTGDMEIVLLQDDGRETRFGEIGEIAVKSRYLALEYWRKPELTRAKFLPVPKGGDERIYFTGDLGRMLPDGLLVHLWRKDFQVKIRGYRVELAEVESTLLTLDNIKEAVVVGREDQALEKRLVAYVVPDRMPAPSTTTLRRALGEKLPDYMVPAAFVVLDAMPLTPNGKVDRSALSAPTGSRPDLDTPYAPPRSLIEEGLAGIWAEVLGLDHVGIHDSFLDLGGHSLAATRVTSRIYADYQVDLPLTQLFKTPTIAALADYIERLHPSHRKVKHSPIRPVSREENLTLSFSQQRLWFLSQLEPDNPVYNEPKALRIRGSLDIDNLKKALDAIVARHEVLHTIFSSIDGNPVAALNENRSVALPLIDLSERPTVHREAEVRHLLREVTHRPFNLGRDLMLRAALFRMDMEDHVLLLVVHHIASDGWSSTIFFREISALYCAFITGSPSPLPNLPIQYADFAAWQRHWLQGEVLESQLFYWKKQLEGAPAVLNLPTDRPRPIVQSFRGARQSIELSKELTQGLKALSQEEEATLFMTLLAGFLTLLHRYTGQADMLVGSPVANRTRLELEGLIGCFVNTLVLRVNVRDDPSFLELLRRVRDVCLEAYSHQDLAFEKIVEELQPQRDLSRSPLVQVMFQMRNVPKRVLRLPATEIKEMEFDHGIAKFDLALAMADAGENLTGSLEYNTDLFNDTTIERMLGNYQTLLESMVARPEQRLSEATILTADEKHQLLTRWNDTKREYPKDKCIHELFETQVEKSPDAVAVVYEDQQLTYRELNRRANQLAHYLKKLDVGPEVLVAICMARSLEMIVGLLGILKAGGAYVPLDPEYPKDRLAFMLEESRVSVLLTQQPLIEGLPEHIAREVCLDRDWGEISEERPGNLENEATAENLAYVIYTSGSTGLPKGVEVPHRGIIRLLFGVDYVQFDASQTFLHLAPTSFDASTFEIWGALLHGAKCILFPQRVPIPTELGNLLHQHKVRTLWLTSSLFNMVIGQTPEALSEVRQLLIGGEALSVHHVRRALSALPLTQIINGYGPTESTTFTCCYRIPRQLDETLNSILIGRPIANTEVYILDAHLTPTPIGVPGELYIGGDGLARGYLNRPELTAEKFIRKPFSNDPESRLYRTGDRARYLPDGNIEFLGRTDDQVKLRGYRIELGEVEAVLGQHPGVRENAVMVREDTPGDKRLVAYIVQSHDPDFSVNKARSFLKTKLPEYMIPSVFVLLDSLPLGPNGKVDRRALPVPDQSRPELEEIYQAPRILVEEMIAEIWAKVLKLEKVGIHDNFFELGGHSLLATQVVSRLREAFHMQLPLRSLFESPTVAGLAERIEHARHQEQGFPVLPILPVPRDGDLPLSFAQQRLWFLDQLEPNRSVYNVPSGLRLKGPLDFSALEQSLNEIVRRHEALRTIFSVVGGQPIQIISPSLSLALALVNLSDRPESEREAEVRRLANEEAQRPFDLSRGPLMRSILLRLGSEDRVLLLTMHHIASDGWSMEVLFRELSVLYEAISNGKPSPLESLPVQYADFAVWQREWLQGEVLESQLSYWKKQLEGAPGVLNLPMDHPRPAVQSYRGARRSIELSKELTEGLKALSRKQGVTLFMTLLAAFQTLLYRYTRQEDVVVGSPIANRNRTEIDGLIGFFVNTLVLRSNFTGDPTFKELLARVREVALGAYAHQDLPFEKLVEELHPERSVNRTPLFQVLFNMVSQEDAKLDLGGLTVERVSSSSPESKFDLTLYVREQNGKIGLNLVYRADLFSQARMTCFLEQYKYLLEQIVDGPSTPIQSYSLVTPESRELLPDPTAALTEPPQQLITSILSSWAAQTPNQPAISQGGRNWTYSELAERAEILAGILRTSGLERREVVAVYGRRSFGLIVGMVGTLLAGGVLLPIDHALPNQRKQLMLKEARAKKLLYVGNERPDVAWLEGNAPGILVIDPAKGSVVEAGPRLRPEPLSLPELSTDAPAYIFFTSGTTGVPKGVLGCHKSLSHFLTWQRETFAIGPEDRIAQLTGLSFDAALRDIFLPLISGAILCLPEVHDHLASDEIIAWLEREQISVLHTVPSVAQSWLANLTEKISLPSLRWVFFVGEPLSDALVRQWRAAFHNAAEIVNLYGPTETTLVKCFYRVPADMRPGVQPVGRPIPDTQALVFAGNNQLCGINEPGEIVLRTPFRSLGYVNAPEENQKRFVKNPFRDDAEDLIYFTGDAGCYQPDGTLEILGRLDDEVKIRGVRIEPAEVTATLARHPLVESCVVVGKKNERDETYLAAYAVASGEEKSTTTELRSYLLQQLPAAMVPTVFVFLDSLPLTPNGKIDRKALPEPDQQRSAPEESYIAPRSRIESVVAGIWAEVLKLQRVGVHDNFFALGGHSLLATQIVSRIRETLQVDLLLRALFENPTVSSLSDHLEAIQRAGNEHLGTAMDNLEETEEIIL